MSKFYIPSEMLSNILTYRSIAMENDMQISTAKKNYNIVLNDLEFMISCNNTWRRKPAWPLYKILLWGFRGENGASEVKLALSS